MCAAKITPNAPSKSPPAEGTICSWLGRLGRARPCFARRLPTILPPPTLQEALATTKIHSVAGVLPVGQALVATRPFRAPHHTISDAGLIGGGAYPRPGEVSLAHHGVLFLDELPEFRRNVVEALRQPLEDHTVTITRAQIALAYPADFTLVAAMNPCPCGYLADARHTCTCSPSAIRRYRARVSGPLLDRIDIHIEVPALAYDDLASKQSGEDSAHIRQRVNAARQRQLDRFAGELFCNAQMSTRHIRRHCSLDDAGQALLEKAMARLGLSARAYDRILQSRPHHRRLGRRPNSVAALGGKLSNTGHWIAVAFRSSGDAGRGCLKTRVGPLGFLGWRASRPPPCEGKMPSHPSHLSAAEDRTRGFQTAS